MELQNISFDWNSVAAEAVLFLFAVLTIVLSAFSRGENKAVPVFAMCGIMAALLVEIFCSTVGSGETYFGGMLSGASSFGVFVLVCALLTGLMGFGYFAKGGKRGGEFMAVLMVCTAAMMLFVRANNLMFAFIALECATVCLYVMAAWSRGSAASLEAAVKYLVAGGVSGCLFLLGIAFVYGAGLATARELLFFENFTSGMGNGLFMSGFVLIVAAVLFKIAAFPFQFWSPDVYQGAPTPVSAFFAVASKAAGIVFLGKIFTFIDFSGGGMFDIADKAVFTISVISALTIIVGNLGGITQVNVKRLIGFSGIANAGYLLVAVAALIKTGLIPFFELTLYFYLAAYMFANYGLFFVVNQFQGEDDSGQTFADYRGMVRKSSLLESSLVINLASLAGIPPTAGFFGKLLILIMAWYAQLYWLMAIMIFGSVVSIYYYFGWMRASLDFADGGERPLRENGALAPTLYALSASTLFFGVIVFFVVEL